MSKLLTGRIDVSKIDKSKLFKGEKGTYLNVSVWVNDEEDQYGNTASIQQSLTKEEIKSGADKIYLGNLKEYKPEGQQQSNGATEDDDLPF